MSIPNSPTPSFNEKENAKRTSGEQNLKNEEGGKVETTGETYEVDDTTPFGQPPTKGLSRQMKNRHIAMISIGGVIGTGLFLGTSEALQNGGPIGLILGYIVMGSIVYCVMISLGEMIAYLPIEGGHIKLAERFVNPAMSFTMGWNYWYSWMIALPAELSAAATLVHYWTSSRLDPAWIVICFLVVLSINLLGAGAYGEAEFIFASIKVITITGLIILGIVLDLGGGPNHDRIGFRYWKQEPFVQYKGIQGPTGRFLAWLSVLTSAAFSFNGTEIVAIAAGEAKNPRKNLPKAIKRVYIRILLFYIGGTAIIGLLVSPNDPLLQGGQSGTAGASPFVVAITNAGIKGLPSVINAALITSAWSAASSDLYTSSRALYGLALSGNAPKFFLRTSKGGVPYLSILFNSLFSFLAFMSLSGGSSTVFGYFMNLSSVAGLMTWFGIGVTYTRFHAGMKAQGFNRKELPYAHVMQPFAGWYVVCGTFLISLVCGFQFFLRGGWNTSGFITLYLSFILFFIFYIIGMLVYRARIIRPEDMDFITGIKEIEADSFDEPPPKNWMEKFWAWLL